MQARTIDYSFNGAANARGGGVSELTDRQGCAILALEVVPKNLIFT